MGIESLTYTIDGDEVIPACLFCQAGSAGPAEREDTTRSGVVEPTECRCE